MKVASLHVGIDNYGARSLNLRGARADLAPIQDFLRAQFDIQERNTITLTDKQASRKHVLNGLDWLASRETDIAVFQFSGHGTRVRDEDSDEMTGYDQAIVPADFKKAGLILDDDLQRVYRKFPDKTKIICIFDSCYSDRADRGIWNALRRTAKRQKNRVLPESQLTRDVVTRTYEGRGTTSATIPRDLILLAGCRDFETSADAYFGKQIGHRGAFTYSLQRALKAMPDAPYRAIIQTAQDLCRAQGFSQIPQLSGPADWLRLPIFT